MGTFKYLADWDNDGYINRFCKRTDTLQSVRTWLSDPFDYSTWLSTFTNAVATISIATASDTYESKYFGKYYFNVDVTGTSNEGIKIFSDGVGYDITTTSGKVYTVVVWLRANPTSDAYSAFDYRVRLYSNNYTTAEVTATGTAQETAWTKVAVSYTAGASDNLTLQIVNMTGAARGFFVAGIMVFESVSAITVPDGYNSGHATNIYDDFTAEAKDGAWQLGMFKPYQQMGDEGKADITLDNTSALFTPENSTSALYGYITPGLRFEVGHWMGTAMTGYRQMYTGQLDSPPIRIPYQGAATNSGKTECTLHAISNKLWLDTQDFEYPYTAAENIGTTIKTILAYTNFAGAGAFNYVGYTGPRDGTVTGYAPQESDSAWKAISDLVAVEEGKFYLDRGGTVNLISKYYSYNGGSPYYTWGGHGQGTAPSQNAGTVNETGTYKPFQTLDYAFGANYVNRVRVTAHPRKSGSSGTVWSNTSMDYDIAAGDTDVMIVRLRDSLGRFTSCSSLSVSEATFSGGTATVTVTPKGGKAYINFDNSAGLITATVANLALTGATASQQNDVAVEIGAAGTATYGIRMQSYDLPACGSARQARKIARHILNRDNAFQGYVYSVPFGNKGDGTLDAHQLQWEIGTKIKVDIDSFSHDRDYWIIGERHKVLQNGIFHETTFALEPVNTTSFWLAGVEGFSNAGVSTRAG